MDRTSKSFSTTLALGVAYGLESAARDANLTPGLMITDIVERYFLNEGSKYLEASAASDLKLLRDLRDQAISKMRSIETEDEIPADITLLTFQACQNDPEWLKVYEAYIQGPAAAHGNSRKTNANQTIGSRIKSALGAVDVTDASGKVQRGRAPVGSIIQTYQLLRRP